MSCYVNIGCTLGIGITVTRLHAKPAAEFRAEWMPPGAFREMLVRTRSACEAGLGVTLRPTEWTLDGVIGRQQWVDFDLAFALAALVAHGDISDPTDKLAQCLVAGELTLDGDVNSVRGVVLMSEAAMARGLRFIAPQDNLAEALIAGPAHGASLLPEAVRLILSGEDPLPTTPFPGDPEYPYDMADIAGSSPARRALEIAAAGGHPIYLEGPPGSGKTMLSKRVVTLLPHMTAAEALETAKIYSVAGLTHGGGWVRRRPFRAPHHTISSLGVLGGGAGHARPGEMTLAHNGVLFMDELPEFRRDVLASVRAAALEGRVSLRRAEEQVEYPAKPLVVGSGAACPCGHLGSARCSCPQRHVVNHRRRLWAHFPGVFHLQVDVPALRYEDMRQSDPSKSEKSATIRARVEAARARQATRFEKEAFRLNADIPGGRREEFCKLADADLSLVRRALEPHRWDTAKWGLDTVRMVALTISDLDETASGIETGHVLEAITLVTPLLRYADRQEVE